MGNTNNNPPPYDADNVSSDKRVISIEKLNAKTQTYIDKVYNKALSKALAYINKRVIEEANDGSKQFVFSPSNISTNTTTNIDCVCCCCNPKKLEWDKTCIYALCCITPRYCHCGCGDIDDYKCCCCCYIDDDDYKCCYYYPCCGAFCCNWFNIHRESISNLILTFNDKTLEAEYYKKLCDEIIDILQKQKYNAYIDTNTKINIPYGIPGYKYHNIIVIEW